jgi:hypothetical protein
VRQWDLVVGLGRPPQARPRASYADFPAPRRRRNCRASGRRFTSSAPPPRSANISRSSGCAPSNVDGGSDYAVTSDGGDYTVHVVVGVDPENRRHKSRPQRRAPLSTEAYALLRACAGRCGASAFWSAAILRRSASMRLMARRGTAQLCFGCGAMPACLALRCVISASS